MTAAIVVKAGATISRAIEIELPTGSAWQARAQIRTATGDKVWPVAMTLAEREGAPGVWDGTYGVDSNVAESFPRPAQAGGQVRLFSDIMFFVPGDPPTVVKTMTFAVMVEWDATR